MTRAEKVALAQDLRAEGLTYQAIGDHFGVSHSAVIKWLHPDKAQEYARRQESRPERKAAKRQWDREHYRGTCEECGGQTTRRPVTRCRKCADRHAAWAREQIIEGYRAGRTAYEIAEATGIPRNTVTREACRLRRTGVEIPYAPSGAAGHRRAA